MDEKNYIYATIKILDIYPHFQTFEMYIEFEFKRTGQPYKNWLFKHKVKQLNSQQLYLSSSQKPIIIIVIFLHGL